MKRILFCELCPFTYRLSMEKEILKRHLRDFFGRTLFARERTQDLLPVIVYQHKSLIRRRLGNVNMQLQENKATNLALAVTHIDGLLIRLRSVPKAKFDMFYHPKQYVQILHILHFDLTLQNHTVADFSDFGDSVAEIEHGTINLSDV